MSDNRSALPQLLYLGDVPVEESYHGSTLLYRLLQNYPPEKLRIMEAGLHASQPQRRLPRVGYTFASQPWPRLHYTRLSGWYATILSLLASARFSVVRRRFSDFTPEAVLTVVHGYSWITAARMASKLGIPLHLICHDDWPRVARVVSPFRRWLDRCLGYAYRQASSRLCVSPFMRDDYARRYGITGTVHYPSRSRDTPSFESPPTRQTHTRHSGFACAFPGTINTAGYTRALKTMANCLEALDGQLLIFGPASQDQLAASGLSLPTTQACGLLRTRELIERLREEADALFVPMSFEEQDRDNMQMGFPSKLADGTAVGIPLLIYGPPYCSAVRWARENAGVAFVVDEEDPMQLLAAVRRLATNPACRAELGARALQVGHRFFSHEAAVVSFQGSLLEPRS